MKKRTHLSLGWLALLTLACWVEPLIVDGTPSGGAPLSRMVPGIRETLPPTPAPANSAPQQM